MRQPEGGLPADLAPGQGCGVDLEELDVLAEGFEQDAFHPGQPGLGARGQDFTGQTVPARRVEVGAGFIKQKERGRQ